MISFGVLVAVAACALAAAIDLRIRRIPNWLTFGVAGVALAFAAIGGWQAVGVALLAYVLVFAAGALLFSMGWLGGGDVKLLASIGAFAGLRDAVPLVIFTAIAGGLLAVLWVGVARARGISYTQSRTAKLPYAFAILAGFLALVISKGLGAPLL